LIKRFYDILPSLKGEKQIDAWLFLDAVLDTTCTELDVHLPVASLCPKLIPTVVKRSPLLEELTINFIPTSRPAFFPAHANRDAQSLSCSIKEMEDVILPLCSLQRLTHLFLHQINGNARLAALCLIGKACPSLTHLTVSGDYCWDKKDVLALILGESGIILLDSQKSHGGQRPRWCEDEALDHLLVPCKHLSPLCFTLRELKFEGENNRLGVSETAFALRYLPLLEVIDGVFPVSFAVFRLHQNVGNAINQGKSLKLFIKAYRRSLPKNVANPRKRSRRKSIPTFSGIFY